MKQRIYALGFVLFLALSVTGQTFPTLSNFHVKSSQPGRVYFDSSEKIEGSSTNGFEISGKRINSLVISNDGFTGYFTVSSAFTFFEKGRMIKYTGGSNVEGNSESLEDFTWRHIENRINEPAPKRERYVTVSGAGKHDGSRGNEWTFSEALSKAQPGDIVHVKSGNYGSKKYQLKKSGSATNPIVFQGYRDQPNDINELYWSYGDGKFNDRMMPYFNGKNRNEGEWLVATGSNYVIVRNFQAENYKTMVFSSKGDNLLFENLLADKLGDPEDYSGIGIHTKGSNNTYKGCTILNATAVGLRIGDESLYNLIIDSKTYCDESTEVGSKASTDYYFSNQGNYNVVKNGYIERIGNLQHHGHGYTFKDIGGEVRDGLLVNSVVINIKQALDFNLKAYNNVVRNVTVTGGNYPGALNGGVKLSDNSHDNTFENCHFSSFRDAAIEMEKVSKGNHSGNRFVNCVFTDLGTLVGASNGAQDMTFEHCTLNNIKNVGSKLNSTNEFRNTLFNKVNQAAPNAKYFFSNFYNGFSKPKGEGNVSVDPDFTNTKELTPRNKELNAGEPIKGIRYDHNMKPRLSAKPTIGAVEVQSNSTSDVRADAGRDTEICLGETTTLRASGGSNYEWSTGETTRSIKVSPNKTQTYSVTVTSGSQRDTDEVTVTVSNVIADAGSDTTIKEGDKAVLTASGGDSFLWSNGETSKSITVEPNTTTTYSVEVERNGCTDTDEVTVTVNASDEVTAKAGSDQTICLGESVVLTASGGNEYLWSNGAKTKSIKVSPKKTQKYSVKVTQGSATDSDDVTVTVMNFQANAGADKTIDEGESIKLTASGGDSYSWSNGSKTKSITVSPLSTTTYTVTVAKGNCTDTDQVKVTVNPASTNPPLELFSAGEDVTICKGESVTLSGAGANSYSWSNGENGKSIDVLPQRTTTLTLTGVRDGATVTDHVTITVINCNGVAIEEEIETQEINVYPNPADDHLNLDFTNMHQDVDYQLIDLNGKILMEDSISSDIQGRGYQRLNTSSLTKGIYFIRIYNETESTTKKIIVI